MRTLIYSVEERELGRDKETSFRATHHASCLSRPIRLLSPLNGCDVALFLHLLISYNFPKSISSSAHDGFNVQHNYGKRSDRPLRNFDLGRRSYREQEGGLLERALVNASHHFSSLLQLRILLFKKPALQTETRTSRLCRVMMHIKN